MRAGIKNIDDYTVDLPRYFHQIIDGKGGGEAWFNGWNQQWERFFIAHNWNPSVAEIFGMMELLKLWFLLP